MKNNVSLLIVSYNVRQYIAHAIDSIIKSDFSDIEMIIIDNNSFEFTAIAFGRIGGQNIGVKLSEETQNKLKTLEYNVDQVIDDLQKKLVSGSLNIPDGLKRESFIDD